MMQRYQNLGRSAMEPSAGEPPPTPDPEGDLARSLMDRMQEYKRRHNARQRVHRVMLRVFGRRYRHGVTRMVVLTARSAYKVPRVDNGLTIFLIGWISNRKEARNWVAASRLYDHGVHTSPHPKDMLVPVRRTRFWGLLLVMERAEELTKEEGKAFITAQAEQAKDDPDAAFDWGYWAPDLHPANLGRYEGTIRCLDYSD